MSICSTFDCNRQAIINAADIIPHTEGFPEVILGIYQKKIIDKVKTMDGVRIVGHMQSNGLNMPIWAVNYKGAEIGVFRPMLGGPAAAGSMEKAIAMGARKFIYFGSCGALDRTLLAGHVLIPTSAYRDEGTSYHYMLSSDYVDIPTASGLCDIFQKLNVRFVTGRVWTTDAIYRETKGKAEKLRADGCLAVDMECASLAAVAGFREIEYYQFLYAEDSLDGGKWDRGIKGSLSSGAMDYYLWLGFETASAVSSSKEKH